MDTRQTDIEWTCPLLFTRVICHQELAQVSSHPAPLHWTARWHSHNSGDVGLCKREVLGANTIGRVKLPDRQRVGGCLCLWSRICVEDVVDDVVKMALEASRFAGCIAMPSVVASVDVKNGIRLVWLVCSSQLE